MQKFLNHPQHQKFLKFIALVFFVLAVLYAGRLVVLNEEAVRTFIGQYPLWLAAVVFVVSYVVVTFFVWVGPKDLFRAAAAFLFGPSVSTVFVCIAEMFNLALLFFLSRALGREYIEEKFGGKLQKWSDKFKEDTASVFLLRALPYVPMRFLDLGFGLTRISFRKYFSICFLATPLRIFPVQYALYKGFDMIFNDIEKIIQDQDYYATFIRENIFFVFTGMFYFAATIVLIGLLSRKKKPSGGQAA